MKSPKRQKIAHISEENVSNLMHRYSAQKVLALLQEVSQSADAKMDWNALVKKTATGITNAREYQMLWRHIAYFEELLEKVDYGAEPLDDDSDLEYELEPYPAVSAETSAEAAACVKVLIGSGLPGDSKVPNSSTVEAPLTLNIPNGQSSNSSLKNSLPASVQGTKITVPVSFQKQPVPPGSVLKQSVPAGPTSEGSDANGSTSTTFPPRRKRKPWTEDEDLELIAAVDKCGKVDWQNILKGDFKGDRTASQLSQRWAIIKKRIGAASTTSSNPGTLNSSNEDNAVVNNTPSQLHQSQSNSAGGNPISSKPGTSSVSNPRVPPKKASQKPVSNSDSSMVTKVAVAAGAHLSDQVLAANRAMDIALKANLLTVGNGAAPSSNPGALKFSKEDNAVVNSSVSQPQQSQSNPAGGNPIPSKPVPLSSIPNARATPKKAQSMPLSNSDSSMVAKVAVAAGARIADSSEAATLLKAVKANNAVHIMPKRGSISIKSSVTSPSNLTPSTHPSTHLGTNRVVPFGSPPVNANVVRPTMPSATSSVSISHATGSQPVRSTFVRPPVVLPAPSPKASTSSTLPKNLRAPLCHSSQVPPVVGSSSQTTPCHPNKAEAKKEEKTSAVMKAPPHPLARPVLHNIEGQPNIASVLSNAEMVVARQLAAKKNSQCSANTEKEKTGIATVVVNVVAHNGGIDLKNKNESLAEGKDGEALSEKQAEIANKKQNLLSSKVGVDGKSENKSETFAGSKKLEQKQQ